MNEFMKKANEQAQYGSRNKEGGPFGAVLVDKQGKVIAEANNQVLKTNDPTAHAEILAIRRACEKLGTYDLSGYVLYTSCEPCPMCLSSIIWANIKEVYFGCSKKDAAKIGFRDDMIYDYFSGKNQHILKTEQLNQKECLEVFKEYEENGGMIY